MSVGALRVDAGASADARHHHCRLTRGSASAEARGCTLRLSGVVFFFLWRLRGLRRGCCLVCFEAFSSENLQRPPSDAELLYFCMHHRIELRSHDERDEIRARHCILIEHEPELEDIPKPIECFEELPFPDWTCIVGALPSPQVAGR